MAAKGTRKCEWKRSYADPADPGCSNDASFLRHGGEAYCAEHAKTRCGWRFNPPSGWVTECHQEAKFINGQNGRAYCEGHSSRLKKPILLWTELKEG